MAIIENSDDDFTLICDECERKVKGFDSFMDAVDYKKENGWKNKNESGEWIDRCPNCAECH